MDARERTAIVGAGIIGCAIAFELARRGMRVAVYDGRALGGGATQASAGILAPYTEAQGGGPLFDLTVRGLLAYDDFVERVRAASTHPFEYARTGTLEIAQDDSAVDELRARLREPWAAVARLEWLNADALRSGHPYVTRAARGALRCGAHGYVAVAPFLTAMVDAAQRLGARVLPHTPVLRVEPADHGVSIHTSGGAETFDRAVLCAGAWTPRLDPLGATRNRIRPVRGQLVRLHVPVERPDLVVWGRSCYLVPWTDGTLLVGATEEDAGFDERATADGVRQLLTSATALLPLLAGATFLDVRVGLRPASADRMPVLGPGPDPRVLYAAGHFRNGILLAPLTATLLADCICDGTIDPAFSAGVGS